MKIIQQGQACDLSEYLDRARHNLRNNRVCVLSTNDFLEHIATYMVWREQGGNILVKHPDLPPEQTNHIFKNLKNLELSEPAIVLHTSGTTGWHKLVVNYRQQIDQACLMTTQAWDWSNHTSFLNFMPAFTSGFWHITLPATVAHGSTLVIGNRETVVNDINSSGCNRIVLVPGMINRLRGSNITVDLSGYEIVCSGASQVRERHAQYIFEHGAQSMAHMYGSTEQGTPMLSRRTSRLGDYNEWLPLTANGHNQAKLVNGELWISGPSVCANYKDFNYEDQWFRTGDLWEQQDNLIRFSGRNNDIVKMNGFQTNLLLIENTVEERTSIGECLAMPRQTAGVDWIELQYVNPSAQIDKEKLDKILSAVLSECNRPKRYTLVDQIPKNGLGKKLRHV
jgi:acyl-coenzyme A synthetase/AMP-(fatty) acid ligase